MANKTKAKAPQPTTIKQTTAPAELSNLSQQSNQPATSNQKPETLNIEPETLNYFTQRITNELGITPELNTIRLKFEDLEAGTNRENEYEIFSEDEAGNIRILPYTINRELIQYDSQRATPTIRNIENSRRKTFYVTRLKTPENYTDKQGNPQTKKYEFPKGADTVPFFPPNLCDKYAHKTKIETLILTEGYFKAFKGFMNGLDIVGLSSISHFKQKETQTMYTDVIKLIERCNVDNVILLYDGDCRNISLKDLEKKRDLRRRPTGFINSARNIRELLKDYKTDLYFAAINSDEIKDKPKGLDDLYCALPDEAAAITADLLSFSRPITYFNRHAIKTDLGKLYKWFMLDNVENFYAHHAGPIAVQEFNYNGTTYRYNTDKGTCDVMIPGEASNYFRCGDDYYKFVSIPNKYQQNEKKFVRRMKTTITEDHGKKLVSFIPKYEAFCNVPDHVNFQQVFNSCFNVYAPFEHEAEPGDCSTIIMFLTHIFAQQLEYGYDYLQLLYQRPTQILPILCLVSKENSTGKSTFIKLVKAIFTQNCTIIGNEDFANSFNSFWASKLVIACEESFIEKRVIIEKIKALSTGDKITMNAKGRDQIELDFFAKFLLASNNEDTFIFASKDDIRYWVIKIPKFTGRENVNLLRDMIDEIPAFLEFLNNRKMHTTEESRMWFDPKLLKTEALEKLQQNSRPGIEKELYEFLKSIYFEFGEREVLLTPTDANNFFIKRKQDNSYLSRVFRENMKCLPYTNHEGKEVVKSYTIPYWGSDETGEMNRQFHKLKGRPFVFRAAEILDSYDLNLFNELHPHPQTAAIVETVQTVQTSIFDTPPQPSNQSTTSNTVNESDLPF